jgi:hypothetical protein
VGKGVRNSRREQKRKNEGGERDQENSSKIVHTT